MRKNRNAFLNTPTPLDYLKNISKDLGVNFYLKRDDLTNIGGGGNKLRKLEYLVFDAIEKGANRIVTVGGVQTNHGRQTAAICAKYGISCTVLSIGEYPHELTGNMLLTRIFGADIIIKKSDGRDSSKQYKELVDKLIGEYEEKGEKVYYIPLGGTNTIGLLGYMNCAEEIIEEVQLKQIKNPKIYVTVGSGGTYLGLLCGLKAKNSNIPLRGIAIMDYPFENYEKVVKLFKDAKIEFDFNFDADLDEFNIDNRFVRGGYNKESKEVRDAVYYMARKEGILLDPCYTGKTFAAILDLIKNGEINDESVIMIHTGGFPGVFTTHHRKEFEKELYHGITIIDK